jgi:hypothetical protein
MAGLNICQLLSDFVAAAEVCSAAFQLDQIGNGCLVDA